MHKKLDEANISVLKIPGVMPEIKQEIAVGDTVSIEGMEGEVMHIEWSMGAQVRMKVYINEELCEFPAKWCKLIKKKAINGKINLVAYASADRESMWELAQKNGLTGEAVRMFSHALGQVRFDLEVQPDGTIKILAVDGFKLSEEKYSHA